MAEPTTVTFAGAKGGVGTTTVAALHALAITRLGHPVRITSTTTAGIEDLAAVLGVPTPCAAEHVQVLPGLTLASEPCPDSYNVVDAGTDLSSTHEHGPLYAVMRNDYLSLRRALGAPAGTTGIVLVVEPNRSLTHRDVVDVLARPVSAEVKLDGAIARAADAGLLSTARYLTVDLAHLAPGPTR